MTDGVRSARVECGQQEPLEVPALDRAATRAAIDGAWLNTWFITCLAMVFLLAIFWDTAASAGKTWWFDRTYGHGILVFPISIYLIWQRRHGVMAARPAPSAWGLLGMGAGAFGWLVGDAAGLQIAEQISLIVMIQALILTLLGTRALRLLLFPLAFLFFAVPIGNVLIEPLQYLTANVVVPLVRLSGVPVYIDGLYIYIPAGIFEVARACASVRYLISTLALGCLLANMFYKSVWRRGFLLLFAVILPIIANGLRAYGIVMLAHLAGMEYAAGTDHIVYGFLFLSLVTACLLAVAFAWREQDAGEFAPAVAGCAPAVGSASAPLLRSLLSALAAAGIAAAAPAYAAWIGPSAGGGAARALPVPEVQEPWIAPAGAAGAIAWQPDFRGTDAELRQSYRAGARRVSLYAGYYDHQVQGAEVVNEKNHLGGSSMLGSGRVGVEAAGAPIEARYQRIAIDRQDLLVVYWYWVDGRFTADPYLAKLLELKAKLLGGVSAAGVIALAAPYEETVPATLRTLQDFLDNLEPLGPMLASYSRAAAPGTMPAP